MRLSVYIWAIDHCGTTWSHVLTDVKSEIMLGPVFGWALLYLLHGLCERRNNYGSKN